MKSIAVAVSALALLASGCSGAKEKDAPAPEPPPTPPYTVSDTVKAEVLPQLATTVASTTEAADAASWVIDVKAKGAKARTDITLLSENEGEFDVVGNGKTDKKGQATLLTTTPGELHVVLGEGEEAIGAAISTDTAPTATFTDDFDAPSVNVDRGNWATRDQGYAGVRQCSKAADEAAEVTEGVLRLSVMADPAQGQCQLGNKSYPYRLNGHVGTEGSYTFTHGFAAARIRTQSARGQHSAFWLQTPGGQGTGGAAEGGAEIDIMEYFGDDHPEGGMTSFTYWVDKSGREHTEGGWIPQLDQYGKKWAKKFHIYSVEWSPKEYVFRIDGRVTTRLKGRTSAKPEFLILSMLSSDYELSKFNGTLPEHMDVDWARVWETGPE